MRRTSRYLTEDNWSIISMDKETLIEMMKREYPPSYEGVKDRLDTMSLQEISDMMEFLDMTFS